ncbi:hypothetical protein [Paenibacillus sp. FSL R5-0914]|jgi:hypothetical protein|uniref:hypothetical protein n=1 Tax=Paenibacillus sp. FSL R5-0914 TaxID=2921665 RepID=UPI0030F9F849
MEVTDIISLVTNVGFPVTLCFILVRYVLVTIVDKLVTIVDKLGMLDNSLNQLTQAIQSIKQLSKDK